MNDMPKASIQSNKPMPETILVTIMNDGSYLLQAWPQMEPNAWLIGEDAETLHSALKLAFCDTALKPAEQ